MRHPQPLALEGGVETQPSCRRLNPVGGVRYLCGGLGKEGPVDLDLAALLLFTLSPVAVISLAWLVAHAIERPRRAPKPQPPTEPPPRYGEDLGYWHPRGWGVWIVSGIPVAVSPLGACERWSSALTEWVWIPTDCEMAKEAREAARRADTVVLWTC